METKWTPEQQKEHRKLWVEALRSGKYQQTQGCLSDRAGMCCLGVACDVSGIGSWGEHTGMLGERDYNTDGDEYACTVLPDAVRDWLGITDTSGSFEAGALWRLNDNGSTFSTIADIIEREPPGLIANA